MPNWVSNTLHVHGSNDDLQVFMDAMNAPYENYHYGLVVDDNGNRDWVQHTQVYSNPVFSFRNIVPVPEEIHDEYWASQPKVKSETPVTNPNWWKDEMAMSALSNHWYDWNVRNWGTKWDVGVADDSAYDTTNRNIQDGLVTYYFETAWSPVEEMLVNTLSTRFPTLCFTYCYEEEQGWGGEMEFQNGNVTEYSSWDIPSTHEENKAHDRTCICEWLDDEPDSWFDDCPRVNDTEAVGV